MLTSNPIVVSAVAAAGGSSALIDLRVRRVPNPLTFGIASVGVGLAAVHATPLTIGGALSANVHGRGLKISKAEAVWR